MKKLMILAVVAALLGISAPQVSAQVPSSTEGTSAQPEDRTDPGTSTSTEQGSELHGTMATQYSEEIKASDLPAAVTKVLTENYPGYITNKAFRGKDGTYKIKLSKGAENQTLFLDERGVAVKMIK